MKKIKKAQDKEEKEELINKNENIEDENGE